MRQFAMVTIAGTLAAGLLAAAATVPAAAATTPPPKWIHIASGNAFTCGIREGNSMWCWGRHIHGELGTGQTTDQSLPQQIARPTASWTGVTAGYSHACALRKDGGLWCWGDNTYGELGIGTSADRSRPHQIISPAADGWASISAGTYHTCAIRSDATLWCWGQNDTGALGIGSTAAQDLPQQVTTPAGEGWASVSAGGACAIRADSTLWCWGDNFYGQAGIGSTTQQDLPQQVTTPSADGWTSVDTGGLHTCATHTGHALYCWGDNRYGKLGLGSTTAQTLPQQVTS